MFRQSLLLSLLLPMVLLLVILMLAVSFDLWLKGKVPDLRAISAGLIGILAAWLVNDERMRACKGAIYSISFITAGDTERGDR